MLGQRTSVLGLSNCYYHSCESIDDQIASYSWCDHEELDQTNTPCSESLPLQLHPSCTLQKYQRFVALYEDWKEIDSIPVCCCIVHLEYGICMEQETKKLELMSYY